MNYKNWKYLGLAFGILVLGVFAGQNAQSAEDNPLRNPVWKNQPIARVWYDNRGDQRKGREHTDFRINEDGIIEGQELEPLFSYSLEAQLSYFAPTPGRSMELRQQAVDRAMAMLVMNRILDHEAMKFKMPTEVSDERVDYLLRAILTQAAANLGKISVRMDKPGRASSKGGNKPSFEMVLGEACIPTSSHPMVEVEPHVDEDVSGFSNEKMYGWLKQALGEKGVCLHMNWSFDEGGLAFEQNHLNHSRLELPWPAVSLGLTSASPTWQGFREQIRALLQPAHRELIRKAAWYQLLRVRDPERIRMVQAYYQKSSLPLLEAYRGLARDLFMVNRVEYLVPTCRQPEWPCATANAGVLTDALLGINVAQDRIVGASQEFLEQMFTLPNNHIDASVRFHND